MQLAFNLAVRATLVLVFFLALTAPVVAQDMTYTIKIKSTPDVAKSIAVKEETRTDAHSKVSKDGVELKELKVKERKETEFTETVLEKNQDGPTKLQRSYKKAVKSAGDKTAGLPYEGRTIIFELQDGDWQATAKGEPALSGAQLAELVNDISHPTQPALNKFLVLLLPQRSVKINEPWSIDFNAVSKALGISAERAGSKASARLTKVYQKENQQLGVIEFDITFGVKAVKGVKRIKPNRVEIKATLDTAIDGSSTAGVLTMSFRMNDKSAFGTGDVELHVHVLKKTVRSAESAQERFHTIKIRTPAVGRSIDVTEVTKINSQTKISRDGVDFKELKVDETREVEYAETVLEKDSGGPTKLQRSYERAVKKVSGKPEVLPYERRTIIFDLLQGGSYHASLKGEPALPGKMLRQLARDFSTPNQPALHRFLPVLLPSRPVKINERWTIDRDALTKALSLSAEPNGSKASARLTKVYQKGNQQMGVIDFEITLALKERWGLRFVAPARIEIQATLDTAIDGSSTAGVMTMTSHWTGKGLFGKGEPQPTLELNTRMVAKKVWSAEK
jgi:hypothetical protein